MIAPRTAYAAGLFAAALGISAPPARAADGDIVFARAQDADALDVARVSTTISFQVMTQIYETLLNEDDKGQVVGGLASSYTVSPDNKIFTFTIGPTSSATTAARSTQPRRSGTSIASPTRRRAAPTHLPTARSPARRSAATCSR